MNIGSLFKESMAQVKQILYSIWQYDLGRNWVWTEYPYP